jgi:hypothetical protein
MPIVILTGQATPDLRKSDGGNVTRCAGKDKDIVFRLLASAMALSIGGSVRGACSVNGRKKTPREPERFFDISLGLVTE